MIPWCLLLTGLPNSGKSTLAYHLVQWEVRNALIIDGDRHREMQFLGKRHGFDREDIMENTEHVVKLARFAQAQNFNVIIAQIAPYRDQRQMMRKSLSGFLEVYCSCSIDVRRKRPNFVDTQLEYENGGADLIVTTDELTKGECASLIRRRMPWT